MTIFNPKRADHQEAHLRRAIYQPNRAGAVTAVEKRWARDAAVLALYTDQLHYTDRTWQKLARDDRQVQRFLSVNDHHGWIDLRPYSGKVLQYPGKADTWVPDKRSPTKGKWVKHETKLTLTPYGEPELIPIDLGVIIAPDGSRWSLRFDIIHGKPLRAFELHKLAGAHRFGPLTLRGGFPGLFHGTAPRAVYGRVGPLPYLGAASNMLRRKPNPKAPRTFDPLETTVDEPTGLAPIYHLDPAYQHRPTTPTPRNARVVEIEIALGRGPETNPRTRKKNTADRCRNDKGAYLDCDLAAKGKPLTDKQREIMARKKKKEAEPATDAQLAAVAKIFTPEKAEELVQMQKGHRFAGNLRKRRWNYETAETDGENGPSDVVIAVSSSYTEQGSFSSFAISVNQNRSSSEVTERARMPTQQFSPLMDEYGARCETTAGHGEITAAAVTGESWVGVQDSPEDAAPGGKSKGALRCLKPEPDWTLLDAVESPKAVFDSEELLLSPARRRRKEADIYNWEGDTKKLARHGGISRKKLGLLMKHLLTDVERHYAEHVYSKLLHEDGQDALVKSKTQYEAEHIALKRAAEKKLAAE